MTTTSRLLLYAKADQVVHIRITTTPDSGTPLSITAASLTFVVRDKFGQLVARKTTLAGQITILDGLEDDGVTATGGNDDMADVAFTDDDLDVPPGIEYSGALWQTDDGSTQPFWEGPITIKRATPV